MPETRSKRAYDSRVAAPNLRLAGASKTPSLDEITPAHYARLTEKERKEMVSKLIEFLKSV